MTKNGSKKHLYRLPNFLLIGAAKSGTTSMYYYLKQHPDIYMSPTKEPKFFTMEGREINYQGPSDERIKKESVTTFEEYVKLFEGVSGERAIGEASTTYLSHLEGAAIKIQQTIPEVKLIAVLRHPADRAYSAYMHLRRMGVENEEEFEKALALEPSRQEQNFYEYWMYRQRGYYYQQLKTYYDLFPKEQIKVFLYEDMLSDLQGTLRETFRFLGVDHDFSPDTSAWHNKSGIPKSEGVSTFLTQKHPLKELAKKIVPERWGHRLVSKVQGTILKQEQIPPAVRASMTQDYREDILQLQDLINRDLSRWLQP